MSLLEDVFLEDEAGEAQELERVIEGDEFDERPAPVSGEDSNENSEKEDEAEEDKRRVDPTSTKTKRVSKNPRFVLNPARLTGPRGIQVIPDHFKDFKFKGKGHEKEDLDLVLKKLEHWAYRLYPKFQFEDCLKKIETLGKKRPVMVHLHKIRSDQYISDDIIVQKDSSDDEDSHPQPPPEQDEFDKLLQQQIELARSTPGPNSAKKPGFGTPRVDQSISMPKATSSPSISDEQKERMLRNRRLAEERRLARLKNAEQQNNISIINEVPIEVENHYASHDNPGSNVTVTNDVIDVENHQNQSSDRSRNNITIANEIPIEVEYHQKQSTKDITIVNEVPFEVENQESEPPRKKQNRSNVIDSSDDDCEELVVNESVTVDVHNSRTDDVTENHVYARKNKMYNSDEEETVKSINVDDNEEINEPIKKFSKSNVIDSSDDEEVVNEESNDFNEPIKKHSKTNVIDSSDDKEVAMNKPDIHDTRPRYDDFNDINKSPIEEVMNIDEGSKEEVRMSSEISQLNNEDTEITENDDTANEKANENDTEFEQDKSQPTELPITENNSETDTKNGEDRVEIEHSTDLIPKNDDNITESLNKSDVLLSNNKENIDTNIDLELMDVDFNDDF